MFQKPFVRITSSLRVLHCGIGFQPVFASSLLFLLAGCAHVENHFVDDSPSTAVDWRSASEADILENFEPSAPSERGWPRSAALVADGTVTHWPLYLENPFVDKGSGNSPLDPRQTGRNEYRIGWEDVVGTLYSHARYTANWLMMPVSAVVTPPWTLMESDGILSEQLLGYDHDAIPAGREARAPMEREARKRAVNEAGG